MPIPALLGKRLIPLAASYEKKVFSAKKKKKKNAPGSPSNNIVYDVLNSRAGACPLHTSHLLRHSLPHSHLVAAVQNINNYFVD
jgi:hypothetical protein